MEALQSLLSADGTEGSESDDESSFGLSDTTYYKSPLIDFSTSSYRMAVAIDLGSDGIGIAYAYNGRVRAHTLWEHSRSDKHSVKCKSQILIDKSGKKVAFGTDALTKYQSADSHQSAEWMLFQNFKSLLHDPLTFSAVDVENIDNFKSSDNLHYRASDLRYELQSTNGTSYSSEAVFIEIFKHIHGGVQRYLKNQKLHISDKQIEWILTVPATWSETAKHTLKRWALKSKLFRDLKQCRIVYEPDAASIYIQHELGHHHHFAVNPMDKMNGSSAISITSKSLDSAILPHIGNLERLIHRNDAKQIEDDFETMPRFEKGTQYILVDAGAGSVDIACHEVVGEFGREMGVKELLPPTGGAWGSAYIDQQYKQLLINIFGREWIEEYIALSAMGWTQVMDRFRSAKCTFYRNAYLKKYAVYFPKEFLSFLRAKMASKSQTLTATAIQNGQSALEEFVSGIEVDFRSRDAERHSGAKTNMFELQENALIMSALLWKSIFNSVIHPVINHIEDLLNNSEILDNVRYLCFVGGLATNKYFQLRMDRAFGPNADNEHRLQIYVPSTPILAVVLGAAYLSITKNYIHSRVLNVTYGVEMDKSIETARKCNVSEFHIERHKYFNRRCNQWFVRDCFGVYARQGQSIMTGQVIEKTFRRIPPNVSKIKIPILCSEDKNPTITHYATHLADLILRFNDPNVRRIVVQFHFYEALIKVFSFPEGRPDLKGQTELKYVS